MKYRYTGPEGKEGYRTGRIYELDFYRYSDGCISINRAHSIWFFLAFWLDEGVLDYPNTTVFNWDWEEV